MFCKSILRFSHDSAFRANEHEKLKAFSAALVNYVGKFAQARLNWSSMLLKTLVRSDKKKVWNKKLHPMSFLSPPPSKLFCLFILITASRIMITGHFFHVSNKLSFLLFCSGFFESQSIVTVSISSIGLCFFGHIININ